MTDQKIALHAIGGEFTITCFILSLGELSAHALNKHRTIHQQLVQFVHIQYGDIADFEQWLGRSEESIWDNGGDLTTPELEDVERELSHRRGCGAGAYQSHGYADVHIEEAVQLSAQKCNAFRVITQQ